MTVRVVVGAAEAQPVSSAHTVMENSWQVPGTVLGLGGGGNDVTESLQTAGIDSRLSSGSFTPAFTRGLPRSTQLA